MRALTPTTPTTRASSPACAAACWPAAPWPALRWRCPARCAGAGAGALTVGMIYVGPRDDFGYNQAHAAAAAALKKMPGVKVVEEENVPETQRCRRPCRA